MVVPLARHPGVAPSHMRDHVAGYDTSKARKVLDDARALSHGLPSGTVLFSAPAGHERCRSSATLDRLHGTFVHGPIRLSGAQRGGPPGPPQDIEPTLRLELGRLPSSQGYREQIRLIACKCFRILSAAVVEAIFTSTLISVCIGQYHKSRQRTIPQTQGCSVGKRVQHFDLQVERGKFHEFSEFADTTDLRCYVLPPVGCCSFNRSSIIYGKCSRPSSGPEKS